MRELKFRVYDSISKTMHNWEYKGYFLTNNNYLQFKVIGNIHENKYLV